MDHNDYLGQRVIRDPMKVSHRRISRDDDSYDKGNCPAGFFIRLLARVLDYFIWGTLAYIILLSYQNAYGLLANTIFSFFYCIIIIPFMLSSGKRGSPGKIIYGLAVERRNGGRLGFFRALIREILFAFLWIFSFLIFFSREKRSLHDLILDTRVVRKPNSKTLPAVLITVALGAIFTGMMMYYLEKMPGIVAEFSFKMQDNLDIHPDQSVTMHTMHQDLNLSKAVAIQTPQKVDNYKPTVEYAPMEELNAGELGYLAVGDKTLNFKDYFVKVADLHNQGLGKKLVPSNFEFQVALYDKKLSASDRQYLSKVDNLATGSSSAAIVFSIQIADRANKCSSSNYRTAKIQVKKVAPGYSNVFTPNVLLERKHLTISCPDYMDGTEIIFKIQNTFYRKVGGEIEVNARIKARINQ